jgi:hypothetical protein
MKKCDELIRLRLQWHQARMESLLTAGESREAASGQAYDEVRRLTAKDLREFAALREREAQRAGPKAPPAGNAYPHLDEEKQCPRCGGWNVLVDDPGEREPDMQERACWCEDCGLEWYDVYDLWPYFIGKDIEGDLCQDPRQVIEQAARDDVWELVDAASRVLADVEERHPDWDTAVRLRAVIDRIEKGAFTHEPRSQE